MDIIVFINRAKAKIEGNSMSRKIMLLSTMIVIVLLLSGCIVDRDPPSAEDAKEFLAQHQDDIDVVVKWLRDLEYDYACIKNARGIIFYEFDDHPIRQEDVKTSVRNLWSSGCKFICKDDEQGTNTISFEIWYRTVGDQDCGIACTIDGQGTPKTEFQIKCERITEDWFYYYDDYEEYRNHPPQES